MRFVTHTPKLLLVLAFLSQIAVFSFVAQHRFIDFDEGSYLLAARLVLAHKTPYLDFFYNQAPLLPYVYAAWMKCTQISWVSAKLFSALLTGLLGTLLCADVWARTRSRAAGCAALILFASSTLVFAWFPIVKTYSLAGMFLFASYFVTGRISTRFSLWLVLSGGLFFGLSVDARSYLLLLIPVFVCWVVTHTAFEVRLRAVVWFLVGFAIGTLPALWLFLSSPDIFLFDNLRYHALRSSSGLVGWSWEKVLIVLQLFLGSGTANGLQWSILVFVVVGLALAVPNKKLSARLAMQLAIGVALISLLPTPAYVQYFSLCVPFLIAAAVTAVVDLWGGLVSHRERVVAGLCCAVLVTLYVAASANDLRRYLITGDGVPGMNPSTDRNDWRLTRVLQASQEVDKIASPGEAVASFWPGDIFQSTAQPVSGFENPFGLPVADKLDVNERARYHILSIAEIEADFVAHKSRIVVLRDQIISPFTNQHDTGIWDNGDVFRRALLGSGYVLVRSFGGISVYSCGNDLAGSSSAAGNPPRWRQDNFQRARPVGDSGNGDR